MQKIPTRKLLEDKNGSKIFLIGHFYVFHDANKLKFFTIYNLDVIAILTKWNYLKIIKVQ